MMEITFAELIIFIVSILGVFAFFMFFDFKRKCFKCGSRWSQTIIVVEVGTTKNRVLASELKYRECLLCRHRMLVRKRTKGYDKESGKSLTIKF
jgi:DNA-directed RNA polymerase subunit RPC12/RpoP